MAVVPPVVTVYFDLTAQGGDFFTIEHPTLGALNTGGVLAGDIASTPGAEYTISISRGRDYELNEIPAGTCRIGWRNLDRSFDPSYTAGPYFGNIVPGKRMSVSIYGVTIFDGAADDWEDTYLGPVESSASVLCVDALGLLARKDFDEWTTTSQLPGARIAAVLARNEVLYEGGTDLDAGVEILQADNVSWGSNVLNYLQLVAKSDLGRLFASRDGVLTYRDRVSVQSSTPVLTFADDGTGFGFSSVQKRSAAELLYTWVSVDREGGTAQSAAADAATIDDLGVRRLSLGGLLLNNDISSANMADFLLGIYSTPEDRIAALTVRVSGLASVADQASVASLDIGDVIEVVWTPLGVGNELENLYVVDGVAHTIDRGTGHIMTLSLSSLLQHGVFIIEDPILGALDTGGVLAF